MGHPIRFIGIFGIFGIFGFGNGNGNGNGLCPCLPATLTLTRRTPRSGPPPDSRPNPAISTGESKSYLRTDAILLCQSPPIKNLISLFPRHPHAPARTCTHRRALPHTLVPKPRKCGANRHYVVRPSTPHPEMQHIFRTCRNRPSPSPSPAARRSRPTPRLPQTGSASSVRLSAPADACRVTDDERRVEQIVCHAQQANEEDEVSKENAGFFAELGGQAVHLLMGWRRRQRPISFYTARTTSALRRSERRECLRLSRGYPCPHALTRNMCAKSQSHTLVHPAPPRKSPFYPDPSHPEPTPRRTSPPETHIFIPTHPQNPIFSTQTSSLIVFLEGQ